MPVVAGSNLLTEKEIKAGKESLEGLTSKDQIILQRLSVHGDLSRAIVESGTANSRNVIAFKAREIVNNPKFIAARDYVFYQVAQQNSIAREMVTGELSALALSDMKNYVETIQEVEKYYDRSIKAWVEHEDGRLIDVQKFKEIAGLPEWATKAIETIEFNQDGTIKKLKLYNKMTAMALLAQIKGWSASDNKGMMDTKTVAKLKEISLNADDIAKRTQIQLEIEQATTLTTIKKVNEIKAKELTDLPFNEQATIDDGRWKNNEPLNDNYTKRGLDQI